MFGWGAFLVAQIVKNLPAMQETGVRSLGQDLCNPGSSVHGIPQARILEWVTISFSRGSSLPRDQTWISRQIWGQILYHLSHKGSPPDLTSTLSIPSSFFTLSFHRENISGEKSLTFLPFEVFLHVFLAGRGTSPCVKDTHPLWESGSLHYFLSVSISQH